MPKEKSHYQVEFCCFAGLATAAGFFQKYSSYHGEVAVDPVNGTILRLTAIADMELGDPILESDISVEYAPVEIGGRNYFCPVKSVSLWVASMPERHVLETLLNSSVFTEYHQFRSESRILIDGAPATQ